jgi:hypothetical protein
VLGGEPDSMLKDEFNSEKEEGCILFGNISPILKGDWYI